MSDDSSNSKPKKPPRIKLTKTGSTGKTEQPEIPKAPSVPVSEETAPPKVTIPRIPAKEATSPVELPPTGISRPKDETSQIVPGKPASPKSETTRIDLSEAKPAGNEDFQGFEQTMRVDLSDDVGDASPKGETSRVDLSKARPSGSDFDPFDSNQTMRIDLSESAPGEASGATSPIKTPPIDKPSNGNGFDDENSQTMRVDIHAASDTSAITSAQTSPIKTTPIAEPSTDELLKTMRVDIQDPTDTASITSAQTSPIQAGKTTQIPDDATQDLSMNTMRVDLSPTDLGEAPPAITPADASMQTMRIDIPEGIPAEPKSETSRISLSATQSFKEASGEIDKVAESKSKSGTIRLGDEGELHDLVENQDSISQQTMRIELDEDPDTAAAVTPSTAPTIASNVGSIDLGEVMGSEPKGKAPKAGAPKTIRIRKTDTPPPTRVMKKSPIAGQTIRVQGASEDQESKSGTARIELPEGAEGSSSDKKTIRIRRPGEQKGPTPLAVARSEGSAARQKKQPMEESLGWGYTMVAVLSVILVGITIYILAAQISSIPTDGVSWPWPGRIL